MKYRYKPKTYRIRLTKKQVTIIFVITLVAIVAISSYLIYNWYSQPIKRVESGGVIWEFTQDVRKAKKVSVLPNEEKVHELFFNPNVQNVFILFVNSPDNSLVGVEAAEIAFKLSIAYIRLGYKVKTTRNVTELIVPRAGKIIFIYTNNVSSYDLTTDERNPMIALVPPALTNRTIVRVENNVAFIEGKSREEFELAMIKFLLSALEIKV
jgi:hypothetical protein